MGEQGEMREQGEFKASFFAGARFADALIT
jgi:hypothetical protein